MGDIPWQILAPLAPQQAQHLDEVGGELEASLADFASHQQHHQALLLRHAPTNTPPPPNAPGLRLCRSWYAPAADPRLGAEVHIAPYLTKTLTCSRFKANWLVGFLRRRKAIEGGFCWEGRRVFGSAPWLKQFNISALSELMMNKTMADHRPLWGINR